MEVLIVAVSSPNPYRVHLCAPEGPVVKLMPLPLERCRRFVIFMLKLQGTEIFVG